MERELKVWCLKCGVCLGESSSPLFIHSIGRFGGYTWKLPKPTSPIIDGTA
jgi:hypothetical protein